MKNLKKILACVMAVATLGSISAIPMNVDATTDSTTKSISYIDYICYHDGNYYKENSVTGKTGLVCIQFSCSYSDKVDDKTIIYDIVKDSLDICYNTATIHILGYYDDASNDGMVTVDSLDISKLDNLVIVTDWYNTLDKHTNFTTDSLSKLLSKNGMDMSQCDNIIYDMPYLYNKNSNEYLKYGPNKDWLLVGAYLPDKLSSVSDDDIISYLNSIYLSYTDCYLNENNLKDKSHFTAPINDKNNFTSAYDYYYYKDGDYLANFESSIYGSLYFESKNTNLTIDDVLTKEQQEYLSSIGSTAELKNNGLNEITGFNNYDIHFGDCNLSYNDFIVYKYKLGQSLLDKGIAENSYFQGDLMFDDYNAMSGSANLAIVMADGSEPTLELFGEYANEVESIEKISSADSNLIIDDDYYYKVNLINANEAWNRNSAEKIVKTLQDNENVKFIGAVDVECISTCLASFNHNMRYEIPILPSNGNKSITEITVGDSTFPRGDINLDGKTNTLDLLMLKKYLLGLMEW